MKKLYHTLVQFLLVFPILVLVLSSCGQTAAQGQELIQKILQANPRIASAGDVSCMEVHKGLTVIESDLMMQDSSENHLFIIEVDLDKGLSLRTSTPADLPYSRETGLQNMLQQAQAAQRNGQKVLLGVNADVFGFYEGLDFLSPRGVVYVDGQERSTCRKDENVFYILKDGSAHLDKFEDFVQVEPEVEQAVGGWHTLVWDGQLHTADEYPEKNLVMVNPRTFIGLSADSRKVYLFVVDGRQPGYSRGFLMEDMVKVCQATGCQRACNLDGGGSTTLVIREDLLQGKEAGQEFVLLNAPSDLVQGKRTPRKVANGLLVIEK